MKLAYAIAAVALLFAVPAAAKPIPGSSWDLITQTDGGRVMNCAASKTYKDGEIRIVIGSQGSLAFIFRDLNLIRKLSSVDLWRPGAHYTAVLFPGGNGRIVGEADQVAQYSVLMRVSYTDIPAIKGQSRLMLAINGIVTESFNVSGIGKGIDAIVSCAKSAGLIAR